MPPSIMSKDYEIGLREAEILCLLTHGERYGLELTDAYQARYGRTIHFTTVYNVLEKMEDQGFVETRMGEDRHPRGGARRKYYRLTGEGRTALDQFCSRIALLKQGVAHA